MELTIGSFNILNTSCRYEERKHLIKQALEEMNCDVVGLQEINFERNPSTISLPNHSLSLGPLPSVFNRNPDPSFRIDGNAILSRNSLQITNEQSIPLENQDRQAQLLQFSTPNGSFIVANTHLDHLNENYRFTQAQQVIDWLAPYADQPIFLTGDFNTIEGSITYNLLKSHFQSAYKEANGQEPVLTFPTGLYGPYADLDSHGCFDYIWYKNATVLNAEIISTHAKNGTFPSDHYPLKAKFKIF